MSESTTEEMDRETMDYDVVIVGVRVTIRKPSHREGVRDCLRQSD